MDLNLILYGVASIFYLIVGGKIVSTFKKRGDQAPTWSLPVIAAAIVAHFWVLQSSIFCAPQTVQITFGSSISAICFFSTLILFFGALYSPVNMPLIRPGKFQRFLRKSQHLQKISRETVFIFLLIQPFIFARQR